MHRATRLLLFTLLTFLVGASVQMAKAQTTTTVAPKAISASDANRGLKEALAQGVSSAILQLGRQDGFLGDKAVRIGLPGKLRKYGNTARKLGAGKQVDAFELAMNRAAEQAIPAAADVFADAVRQMTITDALDILRGGEDAATRYFRRVAEDRLRAKFLPIVASATAKHGVTQRYKALVGRNEALAKALVGDRNLDLDRYVTDKAMDGLFHYVAEQEKAIRRDPLKRTSSILRRVFGR